MQQPTSGFRDSWDPGHGGAGISEKVRVGCFWAACTRQKNVRSGPMQAALSQENQLLDSLRLTFVHEKLKGLEENLRHQHCAV